MVAKLKVPQYSYGRLRRFAAEFLRKYNSQDAVPVPIEEIAEISLGLDIIPIPGLQRAFEVDGFIDSDLAAITVDQFVLENRPARYRFTLAHEIGHLYLHREIFEGIKFSSIEEWKKFQLQVCPEDYSWLEWQAYSFAGLVLVPPNHLKEEFEACEIRAKADGLSPGSEATLWYICEVLASTFEVSREVIEKRTDKDGLFKRRR
jgi:hypothetical protein